VREVPGSFHRQGPRHNTDMIPVVPLFSTQHSKREILTLSQELECNKCNLGWNPSKSEVIGRIGRCCGNENNRM